MGKFVKVLLFCLVVLAGGSILNAKPIQPPKYLKHVNVITRQFAKEMEKEFGLLCIGSGGSMPHDVEEIDVRLMSYQKASIEKARELEIKATEKLLTIINDEEKLKPFLREYPFQHARANVSIAFRKKDNTRFTDDSVTIVYQARGKLFFRTFDAENNRLIPLAEESYEEALKKVQSGQ